MVDPISSNIPSVNRNATADKVQASQQANPPAPAAVTPAKTESPKPDVVELSYSAQAKLLRQQGYSIPEIAMQLKLDVKTVNGFFPSTA